MHPASQLINPDAEPEHKLIYNPNNPALGNPMQLLPQQQPGGPSVSGSLAPQGRFGGIGNALLAAFGGYRVSNALNGNINNPVEG